ncbi:hypothetical protein B0T17DRAFT_509184 [Bombardia bombarda]|uniref:Uncharacterized protein n=1 Tax=Bombardia bombarda TaxID=252184 RepID=A0AA39WUN4_9PEZI|nr:hypothetical protein B0T17DRAFT_509184 [Bombardia bombarda]
MEACGGPRLPFDGSPIYGLMASECSGRTLPAVELCQQSNSASSRTLTAATRQTAKTAPRQFEEGAIVNWHQQRQLQAKFQLEPAQPALPRRFDAQAMTRAWRSEPVSGPFDRALDWEQKAKRKMKRVEAFFFFSAHLAEFQARPPRSSVPPRPPVLHSRLNKKTVARPLLLSTWTPVRHPVDPKKKQNRAIVDATCRLAGSNETLDDWLLSVLATKFCESGRGEVHSRLSSSTSAHIFALQVTKAQSQTCVTSGLT